jgi:hypothetical protein
LWEGLGMTETLTILRERVDDIPLVLAQLERMGVPARLDEHCPTPGNWVGLNLGGVTAIWLSHMLSQAGHRLNPVQPWAKQRLHTLRGCTGQWVPPLDVSDDRLAAVWEALRDDVRWRGLEGALTRQWLRVYDLQPERVRVDSTTASGDGAVTEDGLFQCGHSQDHRPDLPQVTVMLSALDPLGLPVATDVVPGQRADAPRYVPVLSRVRERVGQRGLLSGGDGQMGALETRAFVQAGGAYYRCPLSASQLPPARLQAYLAPVLAGDQALIPIARPQANGTQAVMAAGDEQREPLTAGVAAEPITWTERRLVLRSRQLAQASARAARSAGQGTSGAGGAPGTAAGQDAGHRAERPARGDRSSAAALSGAGAAGGARHRSGVRAPSAALWEPTGDRTGGTGGAHDSRGQPGGAHPGGAPAGLASLGHPCPGGPTLPGAGGAGLSGRVSHRAGHGPAERASPVADPDGSGAGRPCQRVDPPAVHGAAGADAAGVRGPPAPGRSQDGTGRAVRGEPETGHSPSDYGAPAAGLSGADADDHPRRSPAAVSSYSALPRAPTHVGTAGRPGGYLHTVVCRFSQTALKMREP